MKAKIALSAATFTMLLCAWAPVHDDVNFCRLPTDIQSTENLSDFPPAIAALTRGLAPPGTLLRGDTLPANRPLSRLVSAFHKGRRWAIVRETGGFAMFESMTVYALSPDRSYAALKSREKEPVSGCADIFKWLAPSPQD